MAKINNNSLFTRLTYRIQDFVISHRTLSLMLPGVSMAPLGLALPAIASAYPKFWLLLALLNGMGVIVLTLYVYNLIERSGRSGRIYSLLGRESVIVTSGAQYSNTSEEGVEITPLYENVTKLEIEKLLSIWGRGSTTFVHSDSDCPKSWEHDYFILGGPVRNKKAQEINEAMAKTVAGFHFMQLDADVGGTRKLEWHIGLLGIPDFRIIYKKTHDEGAQEDHGILYIGPNPLNPNFRLIWMAGLAPYATMGAIKLLQDKTRSNQIGDQLDTPLSYCSVAFKVAFKSYLGSTEDTSRSKLAYKVGYKELDIVHYAISRGSLAMPNAVLLKSQSSATP